MRNYRGSCRATLQPTLQRRVVAVAQLYAFVNRSGNGLVTYSLFISWISNYSKIFIYQYNFLQYPIVNRKIKLLLLAIGVPKLA